MSNLRVINKPLKEFVSRKLSEIKIALCGFSKRKILLLVLISFITIMFFITTLYRPQNEMKYSFDGEFIKRDIWFKEDPSVFIAPRISGDGEGIAKNYPTNNIPLAHTGYLKENGTLIVHRTLERQRKRIEIAFDPSLQDDFPDLYTHEDNIESPYCPEAPDCHFLFTDDYAKIAKYADSFVSIIRFI